MIKRRHSDRLQTQSFDCGYFMIDGEEELSRLSQVHAWQPLQGKVNSMDSYRLVSNAL
jgi:hypothetical protein